MACKSIIFTTSQTNTPLVDCKANENLSVYKVSIYTNNANSANVAAKVTFGAAGIYSAEDITGHPGIDAGNGFVEATDRKSPIGEGHPGQPIVFTCGTPTSGSIQVNISYDKWPHSIV